MSDWHHNYGVGAATGQWTPGPGGMPHPASVAGAHYHASVERSRAAAAAAAQARTAQAAAAAPSAPPSYTPYVAPTAQYAPAQTGFYHAEAWKRAREKDAASRAREEKRAQKRRRAELPALLGKVEASLDAAERKLAAEAAMRRWNPVFRNGFLKREEALAPTGLGGAPLPTEAYSRWLGARPGGHLLAELPVDDKTAPALRARCEAIWTRRAALPQMRLYALEWEVEALGLAAHRAASALKTARSKARRGRLRLLGAGAGLLAAGALLVLSAAPLLIGGASW